MIITRRITAVLHVNQPLIVSYFHDRNRRKQNTHSTEHGLHIPFETSEPQK
jgi:hypothetical protein